MKTRLHPEPNNLPDRVAEFLKQGILEGKYQGAFPSERKLAEEVDVSRMTIRAALRKVQEDGLIEISGKRRMIPPEFRKDPEADGASAELVILSAEPLEEVYHSHVFIFEMLREKLARHGFGLSIQVSSRFGMTGKGKALAETVDQHPNASWLLIRIPPAGQRWFIENNLRTIVMGTAALGLDTVSMDIDHEATCFHATSVLAARGKKSIAFVRRAANLIGDERSEAGMRNACKRAQVKGTAHRLAGDSASTIDLLESLRRENRLPDGIIAGDPAIFLSAYSFCYKHGLRIPEDIALISRNDDILLDALRPTVARYRVNDSVVLNRLWRLTLPVLRNQVYKKSPHLLMPDYVPGDSAGVPGIS